MDNDGTLLSRDLPKNRKSEFADHVLKDGKPEYFTHFQTLHAIVSGILGQTGGQPCPSAAEL